MCVVQASKLARVNDGKQDEWVDEYRTGSGSDRVAFDGLDYDDKRVIRSLRSRSNFVALGMFTWAGLHPVATAPGSVFLYRRRSAGLCIRVVGVVEGLVFFFEWRQFDRNTIAVWFFKFVTTETCQDNGDVILTAPVVGFSNQFIASLGEIRVAVNDVLNILCTQLPG